jgi:predicted enzyme related to lactoylglutathione lyase
MQLHWGGLIVFLGSVDLEATHQFYNRLLALPLYKDQGRCRIYHIPGGGCIGFCSHMPVVKAKKAPILTLLTEDVDGAWKLLHSAGMNPHPPAVNPQFRIYHFFCHDPNGYLVEIQRFLD